MPRKKLGMVLNGRGFAVFFPIGRDRPYTVWADRDDLFHFVLAQRFQIAFGKFPERKVVAQPPGRIAGTFLFAQHAETGSEVPHHLRERRDDLPSARIERTHAPEPEAVFLAAIEERQILFLYELISLRRSESKRVSGALQIQKKLGPVVVFP